VCNDPHERKTDSAQMSESRMNFPLHPSFPRRQRGAAVLVAMLVVAIAALAAGVQQFHVPLAGGMAASG
jgi:hypothetical protein